MDVIDKDKLGAEKRNEDCISQTSNLPSEWQSGRSNFASSSTGMVPDGNQIAACRGGLVNPASSFSSMIDSYGAAVWEHPADSQALGFSGISAHCSVNHSDTIGLPRGVPCSLRSRFDGGLPEPNSLLKGGVLLPTVSGNFPHLSQLPADSAFIERAARFSCFNSENIADLVNSCAMNQPVNPHHRLTLMPHGANEVFMGTAMRAVSGGEPQKIQINPPSTSKDGSLSAEHRRQEGSPQMKNARRGDEAKQIESDEPESDGVGSQEEPSLMDTGSGPSFSKGFAPKKRKRGVQDNEHDQSQQLSGEDANENDKQSSPTTIKTTGKGGKQSSQASDSPKEEYIHVRARRGQATNSHSLAERVRREKISERMKLLQDLVPGCSKVTGKAVMLDEIINYVQSLQRQVEFLSMKLATVDPRLDFNIDSLLAKDQMFAARAVPLSSLGFSPDMQTTYTPMHPSQPTVIQPSFPVIGNSSDALRNLNSQLRSVNEGYKEPIQQMANVWDDELHNVVQMGFNPCTSLDNQETHRSLRSGHMKAEP